jgi:hypothetical protein
MSLIDLDSIAILDANDIRIKKGMTPDRTVNPGIKDKIAQYIALCKEYYLNSNARKYVSDECERIVCDMKRKYEDYQVPGRIDIWKSGLYKKMTPDDQIKDMDEINKLKEEHFGKSSNEMIFEALKEFEKTLTDPLHKMYFESGMDACTEYSYGLHILYPASEPSYSYLHHYVNVVSQLTDTTTSGSATVRLITNVCASDIAYGDSEVKGPIQHDDELIKFFTDLGMICKIDTEVERVLKHNCSEWLDYMDKIGGDDDARDYIRTTNTITITI